MNEQELNKKLAEWRWGRDGIEVIEGGKYIYYHTKWHEEEKEWGIELVPDFPNDLNACYEWLVPKIIERTGHPFTLSLISGWGECGEYGAEISNPTRWREGHNTSRYALEFDNNPALAICLAIEKLMEIKHE